MKQEAEKKEARRKALEAWASEKSGTEGTLVPASDDASFRRYFRFDPTNGHVFVDAPPELEDSRPFVHVAAGLRQAGINVPVVSSFDEAQGFMMLTDFGNALYLPVMTTSRRPDLVASALDSLLQMQTVDITLPPYDEATLRREMQLFPEWFCEAQLGIAPPDCLEAVFALMVDNALAQPQVFVHRDYHSRNLMIVEGETPGVLDFQDALVGPVTYDLVSLLRDCYYRFEVTELDQWVEHFRQRLPMETDAATFRRWFDLMGFQRHLKCAGIFCRLNLRDGKPRYLGDIPLVISYLQEVATVYPELAEFGAWLAQEITPRLPSLGDAA